MQPVNFDFMTKNVENELFQRESTSEIYVD